MRKFERVRSWRCIPVLSNQDALDAWPNAACWVLNNAAMWHGGQGIGVVGVGAMGWGLGLDRAVP